LVIGQQIGLVGDTGTPRKLAELIDEFFSDGQRLKFWANRAPMVRKLVCWEQEEKRLAQIYEALL